MQGKNTNNRSARPLRPAEQCSTLAAFQAMRRAAAERAQRAYAMLDASRAEGLQAKRWLLSAKDRGPPSCIDQADGPQNDPQGRRGRAHPAAPDRAICAARTKPLRVAVEGNDPLR